jgi:hypothetical protein
MRIAVTVPFLFVSLAGCQAEGDPGNNQVTVQYNSEIAENALEDVANEAARLGDTIVNDVERETGRAGGDGEQQNQAETTANAN